MSRRNSRNSKREEAEEEEEDDQQMQESSSEEEEEEAFVPSDEEEEEEEQAAAARPAATPRRKSAPTRGSSSAAAAAAASKSSRPTRAQSSTAASSSSSAAAAAPAPAKPAARRKSQSKKPAAAAAASSGSKRKKKPASSEEEDESESDDDDDSEPDSSSDDEDAAQCSALKQKRAKKARNSKDGCSAAAAAAGRAGCGDFGSEKKKGKVPRSNQKHGGRSRQHDEDIPADDPRRHGRTGGESLLEHFQRLRALYEPPEGAFADMIVAQEEQDKAAAAPKKSRSSSSSAAAAAAASSSSSAAAAAPPTPELAFPDFVPRIPQSISCLVFTMLSPVTVARCERVNRLWRDTIQAKQGAAVYKRLFDSFFPLLRRFKDDQLRRQDSDVDLKLLRKDSSSFFEQENKEGLTLWAARRTEGRAVPVFNPHANDPLGTLPVKEKTIDELLRPSEGAFHWKHTFINRMAASCVECRALCLDVYKLTHSRVCIDCAMRHPTGRYDVVNSGTAKGKFLLSDRELALLPNVTEFDPVDDHKTIFFMSGMVMLTTAERLAQRLAQRASLPISHALVLPFDCVCQVRALRDRKYGGPSGFALVWRERVAQAQARLDAKKAAGVSSKKLIPIVYRDNVGSTPEKTKGFFLCGRHNLATLFDKNAPVRPYPEASLE